MAEAFGEKKKGGGRNLEPVETFAEAAEKKKKKDSAQQPGSGSAGGGGSGATEMPGLLGGAAQAGGAEEGGSGQRAGGSGDLGTAAGSDGARGSGAMGVGGGDSQRSGGLGTAADAAAGQLGTEAEGDLNAVDDSLEVGGTETGYEEDRTPEELLGDQGDGGVGDIETAGTGLKAPGSGDDDGGGLPGTEGGITADGQVDPLDKQYEDLLAEHDKGFEAIRDQIMNQSALEKRRFLEQAAREGYSVGGYTGAGQANLAMQTVQTLADSKAQSEREKRSLQLAWMEKKIDQNFSRELENKGLARQMLMSIMASGEPLDSETMQFFADMAGMDISDYDWSGTEGEATTDGFTPATVGEDGQLAADPGNPEGSSFGTHNGTEYFSEGSAAEGEINHYSYDADGNRVNFEAGVGENGEYPGDPRVSTTGDYSAVDIREGEMIDVERSGNNYRDRQINSPTGGSSIMRHDYQKMILSAMPTIYGTAWPEGTMGIDENKWEVLGFLPGGDSAARPQFELENGTEAQEEMFRNLANGESAAGKEALSFVLKFMDDHPGTEPTSEQIAQHLKDSGVL